MSVEDRCRKVTDLLSKGLTFEALVEALTDPPVTSKDKDVKVHNFNIYSVQPHFYIFDTLLNSNKQEIEIYLEIYIEIYTEIETETETQTARGTES